MADFRLLLPQNARVATLAYAIWHAGVTPWSWSWQCGPEWPITPNIDDLQQGNSLLTHICHEAVQTMEHDMAMQREIERANGILREQGRPRLLIEGKDDYVMADGPASDFIYGDGTFGEPPLDQAAHDQLIADALKFGTGVASAMVTTDQGMELRNIPPEGFFKDPT
jgi:hypothetical protein